MNNEHDIFHLNFLPADRSRVAEKIVHIRELTLLVFSVGLLCATIFGIFSVNNMFLNWRLQSLEDTLQQLHELQRAAQQDLSINEISQEKKEIKIIQNYTANRLSIPLYVINISQAIHTNTSVELYSLILDNTQKNIQITGESTTRDGFLKFIDALKDIEGVTDVIYPPGAVFAIEPIVFDITLRL